MCLWLENPQNIKVLLLFEQWHKAAVWDDSGKVAIMLVSTRTNKDNLTIAWRRQWHPTPVLLPGKSHGGRSLVGYSPWGREESDTTERLHFHFSLSCIGEGNGNPLQRSCLENPRDWGAWWAAIYGVAQSRKWLKWLSSSSNYCLQLHSDITRFIKIKWWTVHTFSFQTLFKTGC